MPFETITYDAGASVRLPSAKVDALGFNYREITATEGVPATGWAPNDTLTFNFQPSGNRWWSPSMSYLRVRYQVRGANGDGDGALATVSGIAPLPVSSLFQSATLEMAGKTVETINNNIAQLSAFRFRNKLIDDQEADGPLVGWGPGLDTPTERRDDVNDSPIRQFHYQLPFAIHEYQGEIPSAATRMTLQVDPNAFRRTFMSTNSAATIGYQNSTFDDAATTPVLINARIDEITLVVAEMLGDRADAIENGNIAIPLNVTRVQHALGQDANGQHHAFQVPKSTYRLTTAFQLAVASTGAANHQGVPQLFHPTALTANEQAPTALPVSLLTVEFAGNTAPQPALRPLFNANEKNLLRAYKEWVSAAGLDHPEDYKTWLRRGPLYSFAAANVRPAGDMSTAVDVYVEGLGGGTVNVVLFSESEHILVLSIEAGEVRDLRLIDR